MKKKLISIIMSTFMTVSMFSTGYCTNAKAETINSEESSQETNAISASEITSISSVDNSATKYFPEILTQLGNSCQSYSMGYYVMTYEYNRLHNTSASLPENIMSPSWLYNLVNGGKIQGATFNSVIEVLKRNGIVSIKDVPIESIENYPEDDDPYYFDFHTTGNIWRKALDNRIKDSFNIKINNSTNTPITSEKDADLNEVKKSLAEGHIMSFSGHHGGYKFDTVDGPICKGQKIVTSDEGTSGIAHAMTVVGYNDDIWVDINNNGRIDDGEKGAFRVADSYTGSGDNGFFWLAYDALNKTSCVKSATNAPKRSSAVSSEGFYGLILGDTSNDEAVYLEFTVNSSNRNEVEFKVTDTDENAEFTTNIYGLSSGAYSYAGTTTAADGKFVLDLSKYNSKFTREKILNDGIKFIISDTKDNYKSTIVKEVYLYDKATNTRIQLNDKYVYLDNQSR